MSPAEGVRSEAGFVLLAIGDDRRTRSAETDRIHVLERARIGIFKCGRA